MNSRTRSICVWYLAVPEYNLWIIAETFPKMLAYIRAGKEETLGRGWVRFSFYLHPTSMTHIVNIFSASVFGATFPKPTLVSDVKVKYKAVMYLDLMLGPPVLFVS